VQATSVPSGRKAQLLASLFAEAYRSLDEHLDLIVASLVEPELAQRDSCVGSIPPVNPVLIAVTERSLNMFLSGGELTFDTQQLAQVDLGASHRRHVGLQFVKPQRPAEGLEGLRWAAEGAIRHSHTLMHEGQLTQVPQWLRCGERAVVQVDGLHPLLSMYRDRGEVVQDSRLEYRGARLQLPTQSHGLFCDEL
jgi:hypothetical protein